MIQLTVSPSKGSVVGSRDVGQGGLRARSMLLAYLLLLCLLLFIQKNQELNFVAIFIKLLLEISTNWLWNWNLNWPILTGDGWNVIKILSFRWRGGGLWQDSNVLNVQKKPRVPPRKFQQSRPCSPFDEVKIGRYVHQPKTYKKASWSHDLNSTRSPPFTSKV